MQSYIEKQSSRVVPETWCSAKDGLTPCTQNISKLPIKDTMKAYFCHRLL